MTGIARTTRAHRPGRLLVVLLSLAGLLGLQLAQVPAASAAGTDAVMRKMYAPTTKSDWVLALDVLSNDEPPTGTSWDRSSVCLPWEGSCGPSLGEYVVNDDGTITVDSPSRFGGVGGATYSVRDSAGGWHTSSFATKSLIVPAARTTPPDPAVRTRLRVTQQVSPTTFDRDGQVLSWTSVVTNFGNVALEQLEVTDASSFVRNRVCTPVARGGTLGAGASTTCTGTLAITQDFIDLDSDRTDEVRANGRVTRDGVTYRAAASATATSKPVSRPRQSLTATASPTTVSTEAAPVAYTFVARNLGNVTLQDLVVRAPFPGLSALVCTPMRLGGALAPAQSTACHATRTVPPTLQGAAALTDTARATARTKTRAVNATSQVTLALRGLTSVPHVPVTAPGPVSRSDTVSTTVGEPVVVAVLDNDSPGSAQAPLVGSSVRLRLTPGLPEGTVLYGDTKTLVIPEKINRWPDAPFGGGVFLVSGRGEITFVPIGRYVPASAYTVGYQVADANGRTARSTLTVKVGA